MFRNLLVRSIKTSAKLKTNRKELVKDLLEKSATFQEGKESLKKDQWSTLPYPEGAVINNEQTENALDEQRPRMDPKEYSIILFPGQGTQYVGMAKDLIKFPSALDIFELASEILKYNILKLCLEGPKSKLDQTIYAQPAIVATSLAALEKLKEERPNAIENCVATAGFSLGEITALVFAGAIPFDQAMKLVQVRAQAMQIASEEIEGGMATVLYSPDTKLRTACVKAKDWCVEKGIENPQCQVVNYLYPHCKVVGGNLEALKYLEINAKEFKIKRIKRLPVSGAFHTKLMESAVYPFKKALRAINIEDPIISVYSNLDGKRYRNAAHIERQLPKQIIFPVKWEQTMHTLLERKQGTNFPRTFEVGPGQGLRAILKKNNAKAWDTSFSTDV